MSDSDLAELFRQRPDLVRLLPEDLAGLAARCVSPNSVRLAWSRLNRLEQQTLEVLAAQQGRVALDALITAMDPAAGESVGTAIRDAVHRCRALALLWGDDSGIRLVAAVAQETGPNPCGLDTTDRMHLPRIHRYVSHPDEFHAELESAPQGARIALDRMTWGPPRGTLANANRPVSAATASTPIEWLLARDMLVASGRDSVALPREVALLLRGGRYVPRVDLAPGPPTPPDAAPVTDADATAGMHALQFTRATDRFLAILDEGGTRLLRTGGVYQRDASELARRLQLTPAEVSLIADVALAAGLIGADESSGLWRLTRTADPFRALTEERQWAALALAWLDSDPQPGMGGGRGAETRILSDALFAAGVAETRRLALELAATAPAGSVIDPSALVEAIAWSRPRLQGRDLPQFVTAILTDTDFLGITGRGALSAAGRLLCAEQADPATVAGAVRWPQLIERVVLQADLTATALGPLTPAAQARIALLADLESTGAGAVHRISEASITRAFDAGMATAEVLAELTDLSETPVPSAVSTLVVDVGRRHGSVRVQPAGCVVTSDDDASLAALLVDRSLSHLRLHRIASGVAISALRPDEVTAALRKSGVAAVSAAAADRLRPHRLASPRPLHTGTVDDAQLHAAVRSLRAGEAARSVLEGPRRVEPLAPHELVETLGGAIRDEVSVWLDYSDPSGTRRVRLVTPLTLRGGLLSGFDHREQRVIPFALSRIAGLTAVRKEDAPGAPVPNPPGGQG